MAERYECHPLTAQLIIGEEVVKEGDVWAKYTYCKGYDAMVGLGQRWHGHSGLETRFRTVVPPALDILDVVVPAAQAA